MFADNTLTPKEAIRLCALGTLAQAEQPLTYSQLARAIRHFTSRLTGPSLDIMGTSIELLKYEGLVIAIEDVGMEDDAILALSPAGHEALHTLMTSRIRAQSNNDINKLITTLKMRFLHILAPKEQAHQTDLLIENVETELNRLDDLYLSHAKDAGYLSDWLKHDIHQLENHLEWLEALRERIEQIDH